VVSIMPVILHNGFILSDLTLVSNLTNNENIYEK